MPTHAVIVTLSPHWDRNRCDNPFLYLDGYIVSQRHLERIHLIGGNLYLGDTRLPGIGAATAWAKHVSYLARLALPPGGEAAGLDRPDSSAHPAASLTLQSRGSFVGVR